MELWHYWSTAGHAHRTTGEELDLPHVHAGLATASYPRDHSPGPCCVAVCMHRHKLLFGGMQFPVKGIYAGRCDLLITFLDNE
jgi:hypothetical protein